MRIPRVHRALLAVALATVSVNSALPAAHGADMAAVRRIDARMRAAQRHLAHWQHQLVRWQVHVGRMEAQVQRVSDIPWLQTLPPVPDVLTRGSSSRLSLLGRVDDAHRQLQELLRDHGAQEAMQQSAAWSAYLTQLAAAREAALARPAYAPATSVSGPVTYEVWARAFLGALDAPACDENLLLVVAWETQESTAAIFNPLATSHDMPGATVFNGAGVKNYGSFADGVRAARDTLEGGATSYDYAAIVDALRGCAGARTIATAVQDSAWCRGCVSGAYLVGLLPLVRANYPDHATRLVATPV